MTTQPIDAYNGVEFSRETLETAAASLNSGEVPMNAEHDGRKPVRIRNLRAWVDDGAEGFYQLKMSYEIHPQDAHLVDDMRGMSAALSSPIPGRGYEDAAEKAIELGADHAWFGDDALLEAESLLVAGGVEALSIRTVRVYQFQLVPDPQIFVTVLLPLAEVVATGMLSSALWDAIKHLFRRRKTPPNGDGSAPTRLNLRLEDGQRSFIGIVETQDADVADRAIDTFGRLARDFIEPHSSPESANPLGNNRLLVWDASVSAWLPHSPAQTDKPVPPVTSE